MDSTGVTVERMWFGLINIPNIPYSEFHAVWYCFVVASHSIDCHHKSHWSRPCKQLLGRHAMIQTVRTCSTRFALLWPLQTELVLNHSTFQYFKVWLTASSILCLLDGPMFPSWKKWEMWCGSIKIIKKQDWEIGRLTSTRSIGAMKASMTALFCGVLLRSLKGDP